MKKTQCTLLISWKALSFQCSLLITFAVLWAASKLLFAPPHLYISTGPQGLLFVRMTYPTVYAVAVTAALVSKAKAFASSKLQ